MTESSRAQDETRERRWAPETVVGMTTAVERLDPRTRSVLDFVAYLWPMVVAVVLLLFVRGVNHYSPPDYGGWEPAETQRGAMEILRTGTTTMTFHVTGYSYFCALVYLLLPNLPLSVLAVQILILPLAVWATGRITASLGGEEFARWGRLAAGAYYPFSYYSLAFSSIFPAFVFLGLAVAWSIPLHRGARRWRRAVAVGLALGAAVCHRPNFALAGVFLVASLWYATRSVREAVIRSIPVAFVSAGMLAAMTVANPAEPGQLLRGSQALNRGLLQGTYQYAYRWWDWEWIEDPSDLGTKEYHEHLARIETEAGERYPDPAVQKLLKREAVKRIVGEPLNTLKKAVISSVRLWFFIPTHVRSLAPKLAIAGQELVVLALAMLGFARAFRRESLWPLWLGILLVPVLTHLIVTVEPRYSLPSRGVEVALAVLGARVLIHRFHGALDNHGNVHERRAHAGP